jgi:hypothetical protein
MKRVQLVEPLASWLSFPNRGVPSASRDIQVAILAVSLQVEQNTRLPHKEMRGRSVRKMLL